MATLQDGFKRLLVTSKDDMSDTNLRNRAGSDTGISQLTGPLRYDPGCASLALQSDPDRTMNTSTASSGTMNSSAKRGNRLMCQIEDDNFMKKAPRSSIAASFLVLCTGPRLIACDECSITN